MSVITVTQARQYASKAGFAGNALDVIVAIAQAESGLNTQAQNRAGNSPPSTDRGILQINSYWHKEVVDSCAYEPQCAFNAGYTISHQGSDFTPWVTYTNGAYLKYMPGDSGGGISNGSVIVKNAVAVGEWKHPTDFSTTGCVEASTLEAIHVIDNSVPATNDQFVKMCRAAIAAGQTDGAGNASMTDANCIWLYKQYGINMHVVQDSIWTIVHKYRGLFPLQMGLTQAHFLYGPTNRVFGHSICIFGWDASTQRYIVGDPNTEQAQSGGFIEYSEAQLVQAAPSMVLMPTDANWLASVISNISNGIDDTITTLSDTFVDPISALAGAINNFTNAVTAPINAVAKFFTAGHVQATNVIYHGPGTDGIARTINDLEQWPTLMDWINLGNIVSNVASVGKAFFFRSIFVFIGFILIVAALFAIASGEIGAIIGQIIGKSGAGAATGAAAEVIM